MKPIDSLTPKEIDLLLTAAGRAPSGGDIQPWLVTINHNKLTVKLNPKKLGMILDVNNYGSLFAMGAFTQNLEIAAQHIGLKYTQTILQPQSATHLQVVFTFLKRLKPQPHPLYSAVLKRDTNRHLGNGRLISSKIIKELQNLVSKTNRTLQLDTVSDNQSKADVAKALGKADLIRTKNLPLLQQMLSEFRWTKAEAESTLDGLDIRTMELPGNVGKMLQLLSKFASLAKNVPDIALEKQAWPLLKASSHLCVLSLKTKPSPQAFFDTGYTMQRLWLEATNFNLAVHPWTVLSFFVIRARYFKNTAFSKAEETILLTADKDLHRAFQIDPSLTPAFIFRLSYADPPSARSLRYPWQQYTTIVQ